MSSKEHKLLGWLWLGVEVTVRVLSMGWVVVKLLELDRYTLNHVIVRKTNDYNY